MHSLTVSLDVLAKVWLRVVSDVVRRILVCAESSSWIKIACPLATLLLASAFVERHFPGPARDANISPMRA